MAIINALPHRSSGIVLPRIIVKDNVLQLPNDWNDMGLNMVDPSTQFKLSSHSNSANCGYFRVPVDVTNYSTLTVKCSGQSAYKANQYPVVGVDTWGVYYSNSWFQHLGTIGYLATSSSAVTNRTFTIDVSALTGIMFINVALGVSPAAFYIHDMYLS